jgi:hypothetical protein
LTQAHVDVLNVTTKSSCFIPSEVGQIHSVKPRLQCHPTQKAFTPCIMINYPIALKLNNSSRSLVNFSGNVTSLATILIFSYAHVPNSFSLKEING